MGKEFQIQENLTIERTKHQSFPIITKQDLDECPFKEHIIDSDKVMFVLIVGSSVSGIYDEYSDIDLCRVIDMEPPRKKINNQYYGLWNNIHTHAVSLAYNGKYINFTDSRTIQELSFGLGPGELKDEYCLYLNPKYQKEYKELKEQMKNRQYYAIIHILFALKGLYEPEDFIACKFGCQCLYAKALLNHEPIDKDYLLALKRSRYQEVPQEYLERLKQDKQGLRDYGRNLTQELIEELGSKTFQN